MKILKNKDKHSPPLKSGELFLDVSLLNETAIINKSIEIYNDPAPCILHKSAVMTLMLVELEEYLGEKSIPINEFPNKLVAYLNVDDRILLRRKGK